MHRLTGYRFAYLVALVTPALLVSPGRAEGQVGAIGIFPTKLVIGANASSGSIQLKNDSGRESRFQITTHRWSNSPSGEMTEMQLAPTQDLLVFPTVLSLRPGETRSIRVGATVKVGATELSYRLLIDELGNASDGRSGSGVQMLRQLNVPVFIQPATRQLKVELDRISITRPGIVAAHVRNLGSVRFVVRDIQFDGRDGKGRSVVTTTRNGWYVLPGDDIAYEIPFDASVCAQLASLHVSIALHDAPVDRLTETAQLAPGGCAVR
ncbi:MAG: molecular chaperone [Vicinamibacterales bacterium]